MTVWKFNCFTHRLKFEWLFFFFLKIKINKCTYPGRRFGIFCLSKCGLEFRTASMLCCSMKIPTLFSLSLSLSQDFSFVEVSRQADTTWSSLYWQLAHIFIQFCSKQGRVSYNFLKNNSLPKSTNFSRNETKKWSWCKGTIPTHEV